MAAGKVTGTNREVEAVVAASFAARTAASMPGERARWRIELLGEALQPAPALMRRDRGGGDR